jgi:hypothetical protein
MLFTPKNDLWSVCGLLNSDAYIGMLHLLMPRGGTGGNQTLKYETGYLASVPLPDKGATSERLERLAREGNLEAQKTFQGKETARIFQVPKLRQAESCRTTDTLKQEALDIHGQDEEMRRIQEKVNQAASQAYGLTNKDRRGLNLALHGGASPKDGGGQESENSLFESPDLSDEPFSYALGCAFGRWDVRHITDECDSPSLPDPFDPLPVCPPGLLTGDDGLPPTDVPDGYPLSDLPEDGILVDDSGHDRDVLGRIREVLEFMFDDGTAVEREACNLLDESDLRTYFRKTTGFFKDHRKQYSKSRRKAPIYWQLAPQSTDYSVWLYYPKLTQDTFYRVLDLVKDKIRHEERQLSDLRQEAGETPSSTKSSEIADQDDLVSELRGFRKEVERVAPLWNPDMNDGVVINYAPLWRLVQHNRSWQKECKKHWDRLVDGEYDWSHWAMHLWPERVVPKCAERRDLAIAHDLEDVFWEQDAEGDWTARDEPTRPVEELVEERTSRTVKSALEDLLNAPPPR